MKRLKACNTEKVYTKSIKPRHFEDNTLQLVLKESWHLLVPPVRQQLSTDALNWEYSLVLKNNNCQQIDSR